MPAQSTTKTQIQPESKTQPSKPQTGTWVSWAVAIVAALLLLVANSAYWVNQTIFDTENFTRIATTALESDSSRVAIAGGVTARLLENRPVLQQTVGDQSIKLISGLLDTNQAKNLMERAVATLQVSLTSANPKSVAIDLTSIKGTIQRIIDIANVEPTNFDPNDIPDEIVLLNADSIPDFYRYGVLFLWLAPLAALVGTVGLAYPYFSKRKSLASSWLLPLQQGVVLLVVGLMGLSVGPMFKPPVLAATNTTYGRTVVENVYDAFMATYYHQTQWVIMLGLALMLASLVWWIALNKDKFFSR